MAISRYCARCMSTFDGDPGNCPNLGCGNRRPDTGWGGLLGRGDLLDRRYRVEHPLAVGGAGITYLAREVDDAGKSQGPLVAVKVLYQARASGPFLRRLSTEAQILQELAHPSIVELRGFVHRSGHEPYLVTRFEEGGNLSQHVDRHGPLPGRVAAGILRQILLALDTAHQRGVVHRDLKPDNVLLRTHTQRTSVPEVRVADFGIAKVVGGQLHSNLTRAGAFVGTPEYAAPEQFLGQTPTPATDVFAAGCLLYFLLAARPPFLFSVRQDVDQCLTELLEQLPIHLPPVRDASPDEQLVLQTTLDLMAREKPEDRSTIHRALQVLQPLLDVPTPVVGTLDITVRPSAERSVAPTVPPVAPPPDASKSFADAPVPRIPSRSGHTAPLPPRDEMLAQADEDDTAPMGGRTLDLFSEEAPLPDAVLEPTPAPAPEAAPPPPPPAPAPVMPPPPVVVAPPPPPGPVPPPAVVVAPPPAPVPPPPPVAAPPPEVIPPPPPSPDPVPPPIPVAPPPLPAAAPPPVPPPPVPVAPPPPDVIPPPPAPPPVVAPVVARPGDPGGDSVFVAVDLPASGTPPGAPRPLVRTTPTIEPDPAATTGPVDTVPPSSVAVLAEPAAERPVLPAASSATPAPAPPAPLPPTPPSGRETPGPPPYRPPTVESPLREEIEPPRPVPAADGGSRTGVVAAAGAAGCFGVSLVSVAAITAAVVVVLAALVVVVVLVWQPTPQAGPINVPRDDLAFRFEQASPLGPAGTTKVQRQILEAAPDLAEKCGHPARVEAELLVVPSGQILYARIEDGGLGQVDPRCLKRNLERLRLESPPQREGIARVEFAL